MNSTNKDHILKSEVWRYDSTLFLKVWTSLQLNLYVYDKSVFAENIQVSNQFVHKYRHRK